MRADRVGTETMLRFFKQRLARDGDGVIAGPPVPELGRLEQGVMDVVWALGEANVRDVAGKLERPLAYTTVMTTLDRLYKKGLLDRRKSARAFLYVPRLTRDEWERERANSLVAGFLSGPQNSRELLISCLLDAVGEYDEALLESLEKKIRKQRKKLLQKMEEA
jgi:predicted transcriptional regulator